MHWLETAEEAPVDDSRADTGWLARVVERLARLALVNLLWILGVLSGGVLAGLAPATVALVAVVRSTGTPGVIWRNFWSAWRQHLLRAQVVIGVPGGAVIALVVIAVGSFGDDDAFRRGLAAGYLLLALLLWCWLVHLPLALRTVPDRGVVATWRAAALDVSLAPLPAVGAGVLSVLLVVPQLLLAPAALVFFGVSAPAYVIARLTATAQHRSRERLRERAGLVQPPPPNR